MAEMLPPQSSSKSHFSLADPLGAEMKVRAETQQGFQCPEHAGDLKGLKLELIDTVSLTGFVSKHLKMGLKFKTILF